MELSGARGRAAGSTRRRLLLLLLVLVLHCLCRASLSPPHSPSLPLCATSPHRAHVARPRGWQAPPQSTAVQTRTCTAVQTRTCTAVHTRTAVPTRTCTAVPACDSALDSAVTASGPRQSRRHPAVRAAAHVQGASWPHVQGASWPHVQGASWRGEVRERLWREGARA